MAQTETAQPIAFRAEIRQLLDILIHSLYSNREIFLRELVSNASDALNRFQFEMLTNRDVLDPDAELGIWIDGDPDKKTLTIRDTGIGMTEDELVENLGTIAHSGAKAFLEAAKAGGKPTAEIIGQFGVGFYSVFMVADEVKVTSRSYRKDARAAVWTAKGEDTFTVGPAEKPDRGTTIEITLKPDAAEFAQGYRLEQIVKTHSDFVAYPVHVGDKPANRQTAIWRQAPKEVTEEQYDEFYKQLTLDFEKPLAHIHMVADAPVQVYALLYVPAQAERGILALRKEDGLKLYSRKVLIQEYSKDLLPNHFRFIQGVADSEDLPLNVSREMVQANPVMERLRKSLTHKVVDTLKDLAKSDAEKYARFWQQFGAYVKEGIAADAAGREALYPLLRFRSSAHPEGWVSLADYVGRMKPGQKEVYYLLADDSKSVAHSPHLDYFRENGIEVLYLTDTVDSFMLIGLRSYEGFDLKNVSASDLKLPEGGKAEKEKKESESLPEADLQSLVERFKQRLGDRVTDVRASDRLSASPVRLVDPEGTMNQEMQRVYKLLNKEFSAPKKILEVNPRHPLLGRLSQLPADEPLANDVIDQLYESALLVEGIHPNPAGMLPRIQALMEAAVGANR